MPFPRMDDSDLVFVDGDAAAEAFEDFEDLKEVDLRKEESTQGDNTSFSQYVGNFNRLFDPTTNDTEERLKKWAYFCYLRPGGLRGLCWAFWLGLLDGPDPAGWVSSWQKRRVVFNELKSRLCSDNRCDPSVDPLLNNPLSQDTNSPWNVYFQNADLRKEIERDVVRTCPENVVFKEESVRNIMINILFVYCKEHPALSYRQGMHELLGSILLVWRGDVENCVKVLRSSSATLTSSSSSTIDRHFRILMDPNFVEHDTYFLFEKTMDHMWDWYYTPDRPMTSRRGMMKQPQTPFVSPNDVDDGSHCNAIRRLRNMWLNILQLHDQDLFDHLEALSVLPTTFGINWTKLLFSRQFKAYLSMWDAILASRFYLVDYIVVAMVLSIRPMLLAGDSNQCNSLLVSRYPTNVRVDYVINLALHLQDSFKFSKPRGSPFQVAREERPATGISPLKDSEDPDSIVGSFDLLTREEFLAPKFCPQDVALRDTMETVEASLNELRHCLQQPQSTITENVMSAFQRLEANIQAMSRQISGRSSSVDTSSFPTSLRRNPYSVAFDALGWVDCDASMMASAATAPTSRLASNLMPVSKAITSKTNGDKTTRRKN